MRKSGKNIFVLFAWLMMIFISTIAFAFGIFQEGDWWDQQLVQSLRIRAIQQLIAKKFDRFVTMPFGPGNDNMHLNWTTTYPWYPDYTVKTSINIQDDLDILLEKKILKLGIWSSLYSQLTNISFDKITLDDEDISQLQTVYLFKNQQDLKDLGYVVSSYRTRVNNDEQRRKDNIMISYRNIGNVRVLNPEQEFSFMHEIHYNPNIKDHKRDTVFGLALMWWVTSIKGWGICGAAWGINTVILPNKAIEIMERDNHSRTYKNMYNNDINGKQFWIPGLDIAVFSFPGNVKDFRFKNIREYPLVLVMNYDGTTGWTEELFVLSKETDRGELNYIGKSGNCYTWEANGEKFTSCYNSVAR